jgi:urease accessory protein
MLAERLHDLSHHGGVEYVTLRPEDAARRRLRVVTDRGTEGAIILDRTERLSDGTVLLLEDHRAVVVRFAAPSWLGVRPRDAAAALEVGYLAGNHHWQARFDDGVLWVQMDGDPSMYRASLDGLVDSGRAVLLEGQRGS